MVESTLIRGIDFKTGADYRPETVHYRWIQSNHRNIALINRGVPTLRPKLL